MYLVLGFWQREIFCEVVTKNYYMNDLKLLMLERNFYKLKGYSIYNLGTGWFQGDLEYRTS